MATKKSLEAAAATSKLFSGAAEQEKTIGNGNTVYEKSLKERNKTRTLVLQTAEDSTKETEQGKKNEKKQKKTIIFSCRLDADLYTDTIARWKSYAQVRGYGNIGSLTAQVLDEYMQHHPIPAEQQEEFQKLFEINKIQIKRIAKQ